MAGGWMNDDIRRFIENEEIVILVQNIQRNGFRFGLCRLGRWYDDLDVFPGA
jgi:hypothetical protein